MILTHDDLQKLFSEQTVYPIGSKIYRVLDDGFILMNCVYGYEITITQARTRLEHLDRNNDRIWTPSSIQNNMAYGSRIKSWHLSRSEANKAAEPFLKIKRAKQIERNNEHIARIQAENVELAK